MNINRAFGEDTQIDRRQYRAFTIALIFLMISITISLAQNNNLIILNGATFSGNGVITVKDSIRNNENTVISGKVILNGANQAIVSNIPSGSIEFGVLSVRGSGTKAIVGTITIADSLNILSGTILDVSDDILRIRNLIANAGGINSNLNTIIEYIKDNGAAQSVLGGNYQGKIRLLGKSRKSLLSPLRVDSIEHLGWGLIVNNNINVNGKAQIDSIIDVNNGVTMSFGIDSSSVKSLIGNAGIIEVVPNGKLVFLNNAINGSGTIRTSDGTITFLNNINSNGTLAINGNGTMSFGAGVSSNNFSFAQGSTVIYNGGNQNIARTNYGNLQLVNPSVKIFPSGVTGIAGTITLVNNAQVDAMTNSSIIDYNGTGAQTIGSMNYYDLRISNNRGGQQVRLIADDTIRVANAFMNLAANVLFVNTNNTFEYNGSVPQTVTPFTYYNLIFSGSGAKTIAVSQTANGNVIQRAGTALTINSGAAWQIDGSLTTDENFVNNGDVTIGN